MSMAHLVSNRSCGNTKHGAVIVDQDNRVISTGFNGTPAGFDNDQLPTEKSIRYLYFCHAEANAILFARQSLKGCTIYQTGPSCAFCWLLICNAGIKRQVYGDTKSDCVTFDVISAQEHMAQNLKIEQIQYENKTKI